MKGISKSDILKKYKALNPSEKCLVLSEALDYMQSYNGRSKFTCIILAMGYDEIDDNVYIKK